MKVVSFYCDVDGNDFYSRNAKLLIKNCEALGLDYCIEERSYGSSWIDNVRAKPLFLSSVLDTDILWVDADCKILKKPDFDVNWGVLIRDDGNPHDFVHYIRNTESNRAFLKLWMKEIDKRKRGSHTAFINLVHKLDYSVLPNDYFSLGLSETKSKNEYFKK